MKSKLNCALCKGCAILAGNDEKATPTGASNLVTYRGRDILISLSLCPFLTRKVWSEPSHPYTLASTKVLYITGTWSISFRLLSFKLDRPI